MGVTSDETVEAAPVRIPAAEEIAELRVEIDHLDAEILRLVKRRSEVSRLIGAARMAAGGPRIVYNREMAVLARFRELGAEGRELGMLLLRLGRGRLGLLHHRAPDGEVRAVLVAAPALVHRHRRPRGTAGGVEAELPEQ